MKQRNYRSRTRSFTRREVLWVPTLTLGATLGASTTAGSTLVQQTDWQRNNTTFGRGATLTRIVGSLFAALTSAPAASQHYQIPFYIAKVADELATFDAANVLTTYADNDILHRGVLTLSYHFSTAVGFSGAANVGVRYEIDVKVKRKLTTDEKVVFVWTNNTGATTFNVTTAFRSLVRV